MSAGSRRSTWLLAPAGYWAEAGRATLTPEFSAYLAGLKTGASYCVAWIGPALEQNPQQDEGRRGAYAAWVKSFTWASMMSGETSTQVNDRIG